MLRWTLPLLILLSLGLGIYVLLKPSYNLSHCQGECPDGRLAENKPDTSHQALKDLYQDAVVKHLEVPALPGGGKWVSDAKYSQTEVSCLDKDNKPCLPLLGHSYFKGKNYKYLRNFNTYEEMQKDTFTISAFEEELLKRGWKDSMASDIVKLEIARWDDPFASTLGYVAIKDAMARAVVLTISTTVTSGSFPDVACPCQKVDEIFISDITPVKDLFSYKGNLDIAKRSISPDKTKELLFAEGITDREYIFYNEKIDGEPIPTRPVFEAAWSPDSRYIAYVSGSTATGGPNRLYVYDTAEKTEKELKGKIQLTGVDFDELYYYNLKWLSGSRSLSINYSAVKGSGANQVDVDRRSATISIF